MKTEIEAMFLNVNIEDIRAKLQTLGAARIHPMRLMRRVVIQPPELLAKDAFLRVRDEGDKVTLTYKQAHNSDTITEPKEIEVTVGSYDDTIALLEAIGLSVDSYQETRRETWQYKNVEVVIDEWPWLEPLVEIEGPSETAVKNTAVDLGFNWDDAVIGAVTKAYQLKYPKGDSTKLVTVRKATFDMPVPSIISGEP